MKRIGAMALVLCLAVCLSACYAQPKETYRLLSGVGENLGTSQITEEKYLIGVRDLGKDAYTGTYQAE